MDMTPMVDMAFLLVTFFILTTKFRPDEPVRVVTPTSTSTAPVQDQGKITITVSNDVPGRIFFDLDNQIARRLLIQKMGDSYGISFSKDEENAFVTGSSIGMPMASLKGFLDLPPDERKKVEEPGIPVDTTMNLSNELGMWLINGRIAGSNPPILIKGDAEANYPAIKHVIRTLQDRKVLRFGLITSEEAEPTASQLKQ